MRNPKRPKKTEYEKQRDFWYKKLKDAGFNDIEQDEDNLKIWSIRFSLPEVRKRSQGRAEYYRMATDFLNDYVFKNNVDRIIWEYHANGMSVRNIALTLNKVRSKKTSYFPIWQTIDKLRKIMKSMYITPSTNQ